MGLQVWIVGRIPVYDLKNVLAASWTIRRRNQAFHVEHVRIEEEVHHRLEVVRIRPTDVRGDDDARSMRVVRGSLGVCAWPAGAVERNHDRSTGAKREAAAIMAQLSTTTSS
jgi:hypothetical protein